MKNSIRKVSDSKILLLAGPLPGALLPNGSPNERKIYVYTHMWENVNCWWIWIVSILAISVLLKNFSMCKHFHNKILGYVANDRLLSHIVMDSHRL